MTDGSSLINLGDLSKPATVLIEKISDAIGGIAKPSQIIRVAKAQAEADEIKALSQIRINDLQTRALQRFIGEETIKQKNIEDITVRALPDLKPDANPKSMDNDWIMNFFDKGKLISNEEMQVLWGKVLAGEANSPGRFSKRAVNILGTLSQADAQMFEDFCGFIWDIHNVPESVVFPFEEDEEEEDDEETNIYYKDIYNKSGLSFDVLKHLYEIGLIYYDKERVFFRSGLPKHVLARYFDDWVGIEFEESGNNQLPVGVALLTGAGQELATICTPKPIPNFYEYVASRWAHAVGYLQVKLLPPNRNYAAKPKR